MEVRCWAVSPHQPNSDEVVTPRVRSMENGFGVGPSRPTSRQLNTIPSWGNGPIGFFKHRHAITNVAQMIWRGQVISIMEIEHIDEPMQYAGDIKDCASR